MDLNAFLLIRTFDRVIFCFVMQQPELDSDRLCVEVSVAHTITHTPGMTYLKEWTARRRGRYLRNKYNRRTSMLSEGLEPAIPAMERPQTYALDRTATGTGQHDKIINWKELK